MHEFRPPAVVDADAGLALALRAGDEAAVRALYERYGSLVYTVAARSSGGTDPAAADITVHTFLQAWRNSEAFEPGRNFAPWLATIARRVAETQTPDPSEPGAAGPDATGPHGAALVEELLADPSGWRPPPAGLDERVVAAVISEAHLDPAEIYTAADLEAAQRAGGSGRSDRVRTAILGAVGALVLLLLGIIVLSALGGSDGSDTTTVELRPTGRMVDVAGSVGVRPLDAGTEFTLDAPSLPPQPPGSIYAAWVVLDDGTVVPAGSFDTGVDVTLFAAVSADTADQFVIALAVPTDPGDPAGFDDADAVLRAPLG